MTYPLKNLWYIDYNIFDKYFFITLWIFHSDWDKLKLRCSAYWAGSRSSRYYSFASNRGRNTLMQKFLKLIENFEVIRQSSIWFKTREKLARHNKSCILPISLSSLRFLTSALPDTPLNATVSVLLCYLLTFHTIVSTLIPEWIFI